MYPTKNEFTEWGSGSTEDTGRGPDSDKTATREAVSHLACEPAGGRTGTTSRGVGATGAERVA